MHIKPHLGEEIGCGKSGFAVNQGAVNQGFTIYCYVYHRYWFILVRPATLNEPPGGFQPLLESEEDAVSAETDVRAVDSGKLSAIKNTLVKLKCGLMVSCFRSIILSVHFIKSMGLMEEFEMSSPFP